MTEHDRPPLGPAARDAGGDLPVHGGRTLAYVYDSGLPDVDRIGREAVAAYAGSNGLDPTAFPSLLAMENDLVGFALDLLDGPADAVGTVTSGGTESCLLAVQAARDSRPDVARPTMVLPDTVHAAFRKAAHYFGVEAVVVPVGPDFRADAAATAAAIDDATVLVVASAPSYAHGVVDPVPRIAAAAAARGVRCHVDACIGGWVLPYAARLGRDVPPGRSRSTGSPRSRWTPTSTPTPPRAPRCCCTARRRTGGRSTSRSADWPGYTMLNSTMQSTKSGGPLAGAWAVVQTLGHDGYLALARDVFEAVDRIAAGVTDLPELRWSRRPDSTLVALATDGSCDAFTLCDEMARARLVRPAADVVRRPAADAPPVRERGDLAPRRRVPGRAGGVGRRCRGRGPGRGRPRGRWRSSRRSTRPRCPRTTSTACSRPPAWSAPRRPASWRCRSGWPRSTRCSTSPRRRCGRRCWWRSSTGCPPSS